MGNNIMGSSCGKCQEPPSSQAEVQSSVPAAGLSSEPSAQCSLVLSDANLLTMILIVTASTGLHRSHKVFMMEACNTTIGEMARQKRDESWACIRQGIRQLFSAGKDREATEILVDHILLVSPGAYRQKMLQGKLLPWGQSGGCTFDPSGKLENWYMSHCNISKLPPSFGAVVCSGDLNLRHNELESVPDGFSDISVAGDLNLGGNP